MASPFQHFACLERSALTMPFGSSKMEHTIGQSKTLSQGAVPPVLLFIARLTVPSLSSIYPWLLSLCYLTLQN